MRLVFWGSAALLVYTQAGYGVALAVLARIIPGPGGDSPPASSGEPAVSVIVAAYAEEAVIERRVANLRALDRPAEIIVACDGSPDATAERARAAGADLVLELPRGGKIRAQDAGVRRASGEIVAFGDANAVWEPDALSALVGAFADPRVGYACGQVRFEGGGGNQEGLYWRYEMWL